MKIFLITAIFISLSCFKTNNPNTCDPFLETTKLIDTIEVKVTLIELMALPRGLAHLKATKRESVYKCDCF